MDLQIRPRIGLCIATLCSILIWCSPASAQIAGTNVNMVSGTQWPGGDPFLQRQNEPSIAVSSRNPFHLLAGANDYRSVDLALTTNGETGDAWLGLFKSLDGGATWRSILLPGCPYSTTICSGAPSVQSGGYQAAADPTVRAGTNGMFYYSGLVFNRGLNPASAIIVSRLIDLNNKENADPNDILNGDSIQYVSTSVVATGTASSFLDKPTMAVDVPRTGAATCNLSVNQPGNGTVQQSFPGGNIYVTYTAFNEAPNTDPENATGPQPSEIYFVRSTDCGATWSTPLQISAYTVVNQGTSIAVDPKTGCIVVVWREFQYQSGSVKQPDAILAATSFDGGQTFGLPVRVSKFTPFDEGTTNTSFRTNAYPTATIDNNGRVYVAYSARNTVPSGDARIVVTTSLTGYSWTEAVPIDNPSVDPVANPSGRGHQIMPTLTFAGGKVSLLYYDLRLDHTYGLFTPLVNLGEPTGLYSQFPEFAGELALNPPDFNSVFNQYIDDSTITLRRHTFDLRMTQASPGRVPVFSPSILVSQYAYGCCAANQTDIEQMEFNTPNLPLFKSGTAPFMGDYVDLAAGPLILPPHGAPDGDGPDADNEDWHFNLNASTPTVIHAAWTDNRDVQPPADGDWTHYTPPNSPSLGTTSIFEPGTAVPACQPGFTGSRNQNIYTAPITGGLVFGAPSNSKTLGTTVFNGNTVPFQRAFVVVAQNTTQLIKSFRLTIENQPVGGNASFLQFSQLSTLDLSIPPMSSASRPVFVVSTNPTASVTVDIAEITAPQGTLVPNGLTGNTTLNPDITNPGITNPTITNPGITNPGITNFEVTNPGITNPNITNPNITNPGITNPGITNPGITNSTFQNESVVNPGITNPGITNPGITNASIANPGITNPGITNVNPANVSITDTQWTIVNNGNTEGAYTLNLASSSPVPPANVLQLIISKLYQTPAAPTGQSCNLAIETHNVIVTNIVNPVLVDPANPGITNPGITNPGITNATVSLAPGETANVIIRVVNTDIQHEPTFNPASSVVPVAVSQSVNTQAALASGGGGTPPPPPISVPPLAIIATTLPDGVTNVVYAASIVTQGGNPTSHTFSITAGALPVGLVLNATTGSISGVPTTAGTTTFTVQAQDVGSALFPQNTATQQLSIRIAAPLVITTPPVLAPATPGAPYSQAVTTAGGVGPFTFSISAGTLPAGLTLSGGVISGTPTGTGTSNFTIRITDSSNPPQVTTQSFTITVGGVGQTAAAVTFVAQPQNTVGGQVLTGSPVTVQVTDITGAPIPNASVVMNFNASPPCVAATLGGTLSQTTGAGGIAAFPDLSVNFGQHGFALLATSGNATGVSNAFNIEGYCDTGAMNAGRHNHTAIGLPNGKVLVAGGAVNPDSTGALASAELYDPVARTFTTINSMNAARVDFTMTLLPNGTVLIAGGFNDTAILSSAEIFNPATNTFTLLPNAMTSPRSEHTATSLANGKVLLTGGNASATITLASAEIFNPATGTFTATSHAMNAQRQLQHADLLPNGKVLISGGLDVNTNPLASAELYDPNADTFTLTGGLNVARGNHASTLLYTGEVLAAGGLSLVNGALVRTTTAELYNPSTGTWSLTGSMVMPRGHYFANTLTDGTIFIPGSAVIPGGNNADIYDPGTGTFRLSANFTVVSNGEHEAVLHNGTVLLASGVDINNLVTTNSEIFYPLGLPASITITTAAVANATQNAPYTQLLLERGGVGPLTWTLASGALPPGVTLSASGILTGIPTAAGTFTFTAQVTDSATPNKSATSGPFTIIVAATTTPLVFPAQTLNSAIANTAYSASLTATGGTTPYGFAVTSGVLPAGITLATNGEFSGTPTAAGTSTFTVTMTDSSIPPQIASQSLSIVVVNPLTITTGTLSGGTVGTPYTSTTITTSGGSGVVSFAVTSGALPTGLTLSTSGTLNGTPSAAAIFSFTITATDQSSPQQLATKSFTIIVTTPVVNQPPVVGATASCIPAISILSTQFAFTEYPVPTSASGLYRLTSGPDCNIWVPEIFGNKIARVTPAGVITEFSIPTANSGADSITSGPDGNLWFIESTANKVGRITPAGVITEFPVSPATQLYAITAGPDGNLWFTDFFANMIERITPSGVITQFLIPTPNVEPNTPTVGQDGAIWFTESAGGIGRITTLGVITEYPAAASVGITTGPDGNLWFTQANSNQVGRITTSGVVTEYSVPTANAGLGGISPGPDGNLWFAEGAGNKIGRITTAGVITEFSIPTVGSDPFWVVTGSDGNLWFNENGGNKVGKISPLMGESAVATLNGSLTDDGLPVGATLTASWSALSGPGPVTFSNPTTTFPDVANQFNSVSTQATFTAPGTYVLSLTGSDSQLSASANVTIVVTAPQLVFAAQSLPTSISGTGYSDSLVASGGTPPYTFAQTSGTLPTGITLNGAGLLSGSATATGTFTFGVTVTDSSTPPQTASQTLALVVVPPLVITTTTLPGGTVGTPYSSTIITTGGQGTISQAVTSGALPTSLTLSTAGVLSGTPSVAGTFSFTVTATDQNVPPQVAAQFYSITIAPQVQVPANVTFINGPQTSVGGQLIGGSPLSVQVTNASGAAVPGVSVTMGFSGVPACSAAVLGGTLTQTTNSSGVAAFPDLTIGRGQRGFTLAATAGTAIGVSLPFNVEGFCQTATPGSSRFAATATSLPNGLVLLTGGVTAGTPTSVVATAELYDPVAHTFTATGSMHAPRAYHTATLLPDGTVLITGGSATTTNGASFQLGPASNTAEIYNPATGVFTQVTATMNSARALHSAVQLPDGTVLIAGGSTGSLNLSSAEIYSPSAQTFTASASGMTVAREAMSATSLNNGQVLLAGGYGTTGNANQSAEIYDPVAKTFTATMPMAFPHGQHTATLLPDGQVVLEGGDNTSFTATNSIETYNPVAGTFTASAAVLSTARTTQSASLLPDGRVLVEGGFDPTGTILSSAETFNFVTPADTLTGGMQTPRWYTTSTPLPDGTVLVAGGGFSAGTLTTLPAEIFYPASTTPILITSVLPLAFVNQPYTEQLQEQGGIGNLTWTLTSGALPAGITLTSSGLLSGTATTAGGFTFTVQVTDSSTPPRSAIQSYVLDVVPPLLTNPELPTANPGVPYSQTITVLTGTAPYTFSLFGGALPTGLTLASNGTVSGTTNVAPGFFTFVVKITDSSTPPISNTQTILLPVAAPLVITTTSLPNGTVGVPYAATTIATSGGIPPVLFLVSSGSLPSGLALSQTGTLSGTPSSAGTFNFAVTAIAGGGQQSTPQSYTVTIALGAGLAVSPSTLALATLGTPYNQPFTISGGLPPYTVSLSGTLPTGLTFNGTANPPAITGTPSVVGTFAGLTLTVTDSEVPAAQVQVTYSLAVNGFSAACGTGNESLMNGFYAIIMQGFDANGPRTLIGSVAFAGNGTIPAGQVDIGTDLPAGGGAAQHLIILGAQSSYSVGPDLRGCLILTTSAGSSAYRFVLSTVGNGLSLGGHIIDFQQNGTYGSGLLNYQDPVAIANISLNGPYAFEFTTPSSLTTVGHWAMLGSFSALNGAVTGNSWDFNDTRSIDGGATWPATGLAFPANETYAFDGSGSSRGTIQLPSVQQYSANQTLASANFVTYTTSSTEMFVAVIPDANNKPLVGGIQQQVAPFNALTLNGPAYVNGVSTMPVAGAWVGGFSASAGNWNIALDNNFGGTYSTGVSNGTYAVDSAGRAPLGPGAGPMVRVIAPNKAYIMLVDGSASAGSVHAFAGGTPPASVAGTYAFGSVQGAMDRKVTNLTGIAIFDAVGNVTFTQDEATGNTASLVSAAVLPNTYSYNATTGRGVIPATGAPQYVFDAISSGTIYLLDVTSVNPAVQELDNIVAAAAVTLSPNPLTLTAPTPGTMTATIPAPAGAGGLVVNLSSSNTSIASVPATVTIAANTTAVAFQVTPGTLAGTASILASASGLSPGTASVNVALGNLTLTLPGPLLGVGRSFNATVTLSGPAPAAGVTVTLASSDPTIATVTPASIVVPQGSTTASFTLNGVATGTVILTASAPGFQNATPTSLTVTNSLISLQSGTVTVAPGQSGSLAVSLSSLAPTGGITINFTSGNPAIATVTSSVFVPQGQQVPAANPQVTGVAIGSTVITASATGFAPDTVNVQVTVSASFNPTSLSIPATRTNNILLNISAPAPQPNGITFGLSIDNTSFATVPATATIPAGQLSTTIPVTGVAPGSAMLSATSAGIATATATISVGTAPTMSVNVTTNLGQNLQVDNESISLSAGAPANENLTLTSNSPNVLLAATPAGPFGQSITLPLAINSFSVPTYSVQGLASSGSAVITAQATGYSNATATVTLTPSGIEWVSGNLTTTTFSPNSTLTLAAYQLSPTTLSAQSSQSIRTGSTVSITVTSSNTAFGTIVASPVTMNPDTNTTTVVFQPVAPGTTNLVIATPTGFSTPTGTGATSISAAVNNPNISINVTTNVGQNLQVDNQSISLGAAPPGNETLTLTSNSANLLIANTPAGPFSQSITLALSQGSFSVPTFSTQSLANSGTAQLTASAPGYNNGTATITLTPSGFEWLNGNFNTTTFSGNTTLTIASYQLSPASLAAQSSQNIRTGASVSITVTTSDTTIGTIVTSPVTMNADNNTTTVLFHPVGAGTANVVIATPTGFTTPTGAGATSIAATVTAPSLTINVQTNLGQNLQVDGESISLGAAPPSNETLTLTSTSPNLLIANTPAGPFSQSITLALSQGSFSVPTFSMQSLASTGTGQLMASAPGYSNGTATITFTPSAIEWVNGNFNTTTFSANNTLTVASYQLNPTTLTAQTSQNIRTGATVSITVTSSAPTVGAILNSPVTINGDNNTASVGFHPLTAGTTNLVIATPTGFTTPMGSGSNTITATVTAPTLSINVQTNLGQNLQLDGESISLGAAPPNNETLTLSSSSASVLLATTAAGPFSQSITLPLSQGSFSVPGFSMQGLAVTGSAQLTAQAPGYSDATITITLTPSAIEWLSGNFTTTTLTANNTLTMAAYQLNPSTLTAQNSQNVRTGLPVSVTVTSSNTATGTIVTSPVTLNADTNTTTVSFQPVAAGTTNLVIATPSGFTTPNGAGSNSITATVTAPSLTINVQTNLGQNLQVDGESISLGAAPQTSETLTLTSNSPNLLIATTAAGPFSQSITLPLTAGSFSVPGFSIQSLASSGTGQLMATANGYNNGTAAINLTPSAIEWASGSFSMTTFTPNTNLTLASYQLNPATLTAQNSQNLRTGLSVSVTVTSSDTTIGTIVNSPVTINADTNTATVSFHPVGAGAANLIIATPAGFTTPNGAGSSSITATVTAPNLNINVSTSVGQNLQVDNESISLAAAPPSSETLTLSSNSASLLLATTPAGPFSQSITLPLTASSFSVPSFSVQGLASSGTAQVTAAAPGYNTGNVTITLTPSAIEWNSGNFSTTTFSSNTTLSIASYQLNPATLTAQTSQNIRTGLSVSVSITSSDTTIGTIVASPVTIGPDTNVTNVVFQPVAAGTTNLVIATPAGFTTPNGAASGSITATVTAPSLTIGVATNLGQNLQVDNESISLGAVPPTSRTLTLTSGSAALLLATTPAGPFSQSITLPLTAGSFTVPGFSIQALAGTGTALLTASAPGYSNGTATITLTPSGIVWLSGSFSTTAGAADSNLTVIAAQLNATTLTAESFQNIRTGASASIIITSSNTAAGTIVISPVTISAGADSASVDFHPVATGVTNLILTTPTGFTTPNGNGATSIAATVN